MAYRKILIALQGKPADDKVVTHAENLARKVTAQITLLRVITVAADGPGGLGKQFQTELGSRGWRLSREAVVSINRFEEELRAVGLPVDSAVIISDGCESDEIVSYAIKGDYDLVMMAAEVRTWWKRFFFGCPADGVYRNSAIPTLFVGNGSIRARVTKDRDDPINPFMAALGTSSI